jgi:putative ABC transport system permease protein
MAGAGAPAMPGAAPPPPSAQSKAAPLQPDTHAHGDSTHADSVAGGDHEETQVTAVFLGAKARNHVLQIQREMNTYEPEPLSAVIPAAVLAEMWSGISMAEDGLRVITFFVVAVGLLGMLVSLYSSLSARRREMAILRSIGAGPRKIVSLLVLESGIMSVVGCIAGVAMVYLLLIAGQPIIEGNFGLYIPIRALGSVEYLYIGIVCAAGFLVGFVPAFRAYRNTLADGLSVRL